MSLPSLVAHFSIKIFNRHNFTKIVIIFLFGLSSRFLVNYYLGVNVFTDFTNFISLTYYFGFSTFIVIIHEIVDLFHLSIIPSFISDFSTPTAIYNRDVVCNRDKPLNNTCDQTRAREQGVRDTLLSGSRNNTHISYKNKSKCALLLFLWERYKNEGNYNYKDFKQS